MSKIEQAIKNIKTMNEAARKVMPLSKEDNLQLQAKLIKEESLEFLREVEDGWRTSESLTKELCDLLVVCLGAADQLGLPIEEALLRVSENNLTKLDSSGNIILREDGKYLKPANYQPVNLADLFPEDELGIAK